MEGNLDTLQTFYFRVTDIWRRFCEEHSILLDKTFDEYSLLLASDIEGLEPLILEKNEIVKNISLLESARERVIEDLNVFLVKNNQKEVESIGELIEVMELFENEKSQKHLFRFNSLLIDIIEKIKEQNKKNQVFLNKAINSLKDIREDALGHKSYSTYNNKGVSVKPAR